MNTEIASTRPPRLYIPGLVHEHMGLSHEKFFAHIDEHGGWPIGYEYVGFCHSDEREAGFCNNPFNDGWWTVIASADEYYLWKLSPKALQKVIDIAVNAIRLESPNVENVRKSLAYGLRR